MRNILMSGAALLIICIPAVVSDLLIYKLQTTCDAFKRFDVRTQYEIQSPLR